MKTIRITCIPEMESDEAIITAEVVMYVSKVDSYAVAARIVNAFRDWPHIYDKVGASDLIAIINKGGGKLLGSKIEVIE